MIRLTFLFFPLVVFCQVPKDTSARQTGLDTMIYYGADTTDGTMSNSIVILKNNAWVRYRNLTIKAAKITLDQPHRKMLAESVPDSIDSTGQILRWKGIPEFRESDQVFNGRSMEYNFDTKRGKVILGETKMQDGVYYGQTIRKIGDSTMYIRGGRFTTCDVKETPHFFFRTKELKITVRDLIVAKPIVLYIHEVPLFALPFGVFPNRSGRSSGITPPVYVELPTGERQVRNFGYYYAPNDYWDALLQGDYLDKSGYGIHGGGNYAKRYSYNGNFNFSYTNTHALNYSDIHDTRQESGAFQMNHNQTLTERSNLNASINYSSSKSFYQRTSLNPQQVLNRQQNSNINYTSSYDWGGVSASASQSKNFDNGASSLTFPNVTFSKNTTPLFTKPERDRDKPDTWYQGIRYSYNSTLLGQQDRPNDTTRTEAGYGMQHAVGVSTSFKVLKYLNVSPGVSLQETWYDRRQENFGVNGRNQDTSKTKNGFYAKHTYDFNVATNTKIYGLVNPDILGVQTLRHTMTPSVGFNYRPDFSDPRWGYYESFKDTSGRTLRRDRYSRNKVFPGTPSGRNMALSFSLTHLYQAKIAASDSIKKEQAKKVDLMNIGNSISYNFEATEFKLSTLATTVSISNDLAKNLSLSLNATHDFYRYDTALNKRIDKLNTIPRLTNAGITAGISFSGGESSSGSSSQQTTNSVNPNYTTIGQNLNPAPNRLPDNIPWTGRMDLNYDINKSNPELVTKTFGGSLSMGIKLSENWQANYSARFDLLKKDIVSQSFSFSRDLHCWTMRFDWTPTGPAAGYFFIIQVKSAQLQDLKLQKTDYGNRIFQ